MSKHAAARTFNDEQTLTHRVRMAILAHIQRDDALIREREEALRETCTSQEFGRYLMELAITLARYESFEVEAAIVLSRTDNDYFTSPIGVAECRVAMARMYAACKEPGQAIRLYGEALAALSSAPNGRRATTLTREIGEELKTTSSKL